MLVVLFEIPKSPQDWQRWSWHHRFSHQAIIQAISAQGGPALNLYQLDPISPEDFGGFLQRNFQSHIEMDAALGLQSADLQDVDLNDESQKDSWVNLHYQEHYSAERLLKI